MISLTLSYYRLLILYILGVNHLVTKKILSFVEPLKGWARPQGMNQMQIVFLVFLFKANRSQVFASFLHLLVSILSLAMVVHG